MAVRKHNRRCSRIASTAVFSSSASSASCCSCSNNNVSLHRTLILLACFANVSDCIHHMQRKAPQRLQSRQTSNSVPLSVTNQCPDDIYPGISTQSGNGPLVNGFRLKPGEQRSLTVSENWQGRVWGRSNCSFNADGTAPAGNTVGKACGSGDCNGVLNCVVGGDTPTTLAEFTLDAGDGHSYYDISLVDGYNLPMAVEVEAAVNAPYEVIPPNLTNPCCSGTAGLLAPQTWDPYANGQTFLGTDSANPLPLDTSITNSTVLNWCPWNLQVNMPTPPADGVYMYPDNSLTRPAFNPCLSACAKWNLPVDCCTGPYNSVSVCRPSEYSKAAKKVCPDVYTYAFDDVTSTFVIPTGAGFNVVFCPGGRSSTILSAMSRTGASNSEAQVLFVRDDNELQARGREHNVQGYHQQEDRSDSLMKRDEYNWTGIEAAHLPLRGIRRAAMKRRGLHLTAWTKARRHEVMHENGPLWTIFSRRSNAIALGPGEVRSTTWYLMGGGLFITAAVFVML